MGRTSRWAYVGIDVGVLEPGEKVTFEIQVWSIRNPFWGTQFSGIGFALDKGNQKDMLAASACHVGRRSDAGLSILGPNYSPIFLLGGADLSKSDLE